ncbi:MAG: F0F1 ATP synthase subunit delta [Gammaproteobacteria bacterium]|nr:F0F1 ATP synthase subunit delta [Gammaproteobacteria bacterium]
MQENRTLARPYAQAAFERAREEGGLAAWSEALAFLSAVVADPDMRRVISDPRIGRQRLQELLFNLGGARFSPSFQNFIKVLTAARRLGISTAIARLFEQHRADAVNVAHAEIATAYALDAAEEARIGNAMQKRLGKQVLIKQRIDHSLIGGAVVRVGDTVYDVSLKGGLNQLANLFNWK